MNGFDTKRLTDDGSSQTITDSADSFLKIIRKQII